MSSISFLTQQDDDQVTAIKPNLFFIYTFSAYDLHGRLKDLGSQQLQLVKTFASSKFCNPNHLLQIGFNASQGPQSNHEVATFALTECLSAFLSSPSPDYQKIALIVRRLISVASIYRGETDDDAVYAMYKQAYRIMVGLKDGEYPTEEGKWLAITAWNRAAMPVCLGHVDAAKKWMNMGLEVASKVAGMDTYRSCMEDFVTAFAKRFAQTDDGASQSQQVV